jgi:hypothetical protein
MVLNEARDVVNNTSDRYECAAVLTLVDVVVPFHDWELFERYTPVESVTLLVELLLLLLDTALLDLVGTELLEVVCETNLLVDPDEPLGWIILPPFNGVAVVRWEFMVKIMVAFAECDKSSDDVIARRVAVVEGLISEPMGEGVDAKSSLLNEEDAEDTSVDETAPEITPAQSCDDCWEDKAHGEDNADIILVLPDDDWVLVEIGDVGTTNSLRVLLHDLVFILAAEIARKG